MTDRLRQGVSGPVSIASRLPAPLPVLQPMRDDRLKIEPAGRHPPCRINPRVSSLRAGIGRTSVCPLEEQAPAPSCPVVRLDPVPRTVRNQAQGHHADSGFEEDRANPYPGVPPRNRDFTLQLREESGSASSTSGDPRYQTLLSPPDRSLLGQPDDHDLLLVRPCQRITCA
jgi:hypothetical protein